MNTTQIVCSRHPEYRWDEVAAVVQGAPGATPEEVIEILRQAAEEWAAEQTD